MPGVAVGVGVTVAVAVEVRVGVAVRTSDLGLTPGRERGAALLVEVEVAVGVVVGVEVGVEVDGVDVAPTVACAYSDQGPGLPDPSTGRTA